MSLIFKVTRVNRINLYANPNEKGKDDERQLRRYQLRKELIEKNKNGNDTNDYNPNGTFSRKI